MKDEIKEILQQLKQHISIVSIEDEDLLLDYITNLQEERNMYKDSFEIMSKNYFEEKSRNEKAIEYTKQFINGKTSRIDEWKNVELVLETIVQLLQGEENDN